MKIEVECPLSTDNGRKYDPEAFKKALKEYKNNHIDGMYGSIEHPDSIYGLLTNRLSDIAVKYDDINIDKKFDNELLNAKVEILNTPKGQIAQQLCANGVPMKVESNVISNPETGEMQIMSFDFVIDKNVITKNKVLDFISKFQNDGTIKTFTEGCCYWFAIILCERFNMSGNTTSIVFNPISGHFAANIDGNMYDVTGEIPQSDEWTSWDKWLKEEPVYGETVIRDCIYKYKEPQND